VGQTQPGERDLAAYTAEPVRPVQADSPHHALRRSNANLVKSSERVSLNSVEPRKQRHKNIVDNRTNKRTKKRGRRPRRRCKYGVTLESRVRCAREENERFVRQFRRDEQTERRNRDLVRAGERPDARARRRRRKKRQRRVSGSRGEQSREQRRELRRLEKRRQRKKAEKNRTRAGRRLRHSGRPRLQKSLTVRSIQTLPGRPARCQQKHVDTCSWPQCNRSCPKLHNPLTGEEMDFLELLQSFGLDMASVAKALGIDIATLNNMDKDVLLHLLTSQTSGQPAN